MTDIDISAEDVADALVFLAGGTAIGVGLVAPVAAAPAAALISVLASVVRSMGVEDAEAGIRALAKRHAADEGITDAELRADEDAVIAEGS